MYPLKDTNGKITGYTKWPNDQASTKIDETSQDWLDYLNGINASNEQEWVNSEMIICRNAIDELEDGDPRARSTIVAWRQYRKDLRNHVVSGVIMGSRPARPIPV